MSESANLLRLFRVDQQIRGLRSRLTHAEKFLADQQKLQGDLSGRKTSASGQMKIAKTATASAEGEIARIEARTAHLREQMNTARTNKEYSALLTEVNTLKAARENHERTQLEQMERVEELTRQLGDVDNQLKDRDTILHTAKSDRDKQEAAIKDRLKELTAERATVRESVDLAHARKLDELVARLGDEAMSQVEEIDRRNHEWSCGSCRMALPPQMLSVISRGRLANCPNCGCFLFTELDVVSKKLPSDEADKPKKAAKPRVSKPKVAKVAKEGAEGEAPAKSKKTKAGSNGTHNGSGAAGEVEAKPATNEEVA
ncbi:hypothetical protein BH11PLA1_BH11PLA1_03960 [soil metagenome]